MMLDIYNAVPVGFVDNPWMWWVGRALQSLTLMMLGVAVGLRLEKRKRR